MSGTSGESRIRVWAEQRGENQLLMTWTWDESVGSTRDTDADRRSVAATVSVLGGILASDANDDGVLVQYDSEQIAKADIAAAVRSALTQPDDLRTRANGLMRRAPAYISLARSLALDERVSPMPEAARQVATRSTAPSTLPLRFVPGFPLISKVIGILPVLGTLSRWSREASPEVVAEHLTEAGLTRDQIDVDLATARESVEFARRFAGDKAGQAATRAASAIARARSVTRDWVHQHTESSDSEDTQGSS
ncbi:MAG: hypothetical protein M9890_02290 [Thermomicrobiales bacterium]|nr:hypothetical protein [Thermomicrobiales bacterium]